MATPPVLSNLEELRAQMSALANKSEQPESTIRQLEAAESTTLGAPAATAAQTVLAELATATEPVRFAPARHPVAISRAQPVQRSVSSLRITPVTGAIPPVCDRLSVGHVPRAVSASHLGAGTTTKDALLTAPIVRAASAAPVPPVPPVTHEVPASAMEPPTGAPPSYLAASIADSFLKMASGGLLARTKPFHLAFIPEEPSGSPGRGKGSYILRELLEISRSVDRGIWNVCKIIAMRTPEIDMTQGLSLQRPKGVVQAVVKQKVLPLLPEFKIYERYSLWPLIKYFLLILRSSSNLYRINWAKANPELAALKKLDKAKSKAVAKEKAKGKGKEKGPGRIRSRIPVGRPDKSMEEPEDQPAPDVTAAGGFMGDFVVEEDVLFFDGTEKAAVNEDDSDDVMEGLTRDISTLNVQGSKAQVGEEEDDGPVLLANILPPDLFVSTRNTPASAPASRIQPAVEPVTIPVTASPAPEAMATPALTFSFNNTATSTASSMSTSNATANISAPPLPLQKTVLPMTMASQADAVEQLLQMPNEYIATLPPSVLQKLQQRLGSSNPLPANPAREKPRPKMRAPTAETEPEDTNPLGDNPHVPVPNEDLAPNNSSLRGRGGGRGGRGARGGRGNGRGKGKSSDVNIGGEGEVGLSQGIAAGRVTRTSSKAAKASEAVSGPGSSKRGARK